MNKKQDYNNKEKSLNYYVEEMHYLDKGSTRKATMMADSREHTRKIPANV